MAHNLTMTPPDELIALASQAMQNAYAPYSGFRVGAALLCADGAVFTGCNVENVSFGATVCAERSAVCAAVSAGKRTFSAIAIVSSGAELTPPCGICRQTLAEFSPKLIVYLGKPGGIIERRTLEELLPGGKFTI